MKIKRNENSTHSIYHENFFIYGTWQVTVVSVCIHCVFVQRLSSYGITVSELTGDHQLSKEQIVATQVSILRLVTHLLTLSKLEIHGKVVAI